MLSSTRTLAGSQAGHADGLVVIDPREGSTPDLRTASGDAARSAAGLVTSAITGRLDPLKDLGPVVIPDYPPSIREVWAPKFPTADKVAEAAAKFVSLPKWQGEEGPRFRLVVSPGAVAVESRDYAKAERSAERQVKAHQHEVEMTAAYIAELRAEGYTDDEIAEHLKQVPTREIKEWSRKSKSRMFRCFCELDYAPLLDRLGAPAMITLTYPGDWRTVAPDGKTVKQHFKAFRKRYERRWGVPLLGMWKLEFQGRGAPHYHIFTMVPEQGTAEAKEFRAWLSQAWAEIVGHPDPVEFEKHRKAGTGVDYSEGLKSKDPRRIAVYFSKHGLYGAKAYQNEVPKEWQEPGKGPGRFWGVWGLKRCTKVVEVEPQAALMAARVMRRWARAQDVTHLVTVKRYKDGAHVETAYPEVQGLAGAQLIEAHKPRRRKVRRRVKRLACGRGWISFNDAPAFAEELARYLGTCAKPPPLSTVVTRLQHGMQRKAEVKILTRHIVRQHENHQDWHRLLNVVGAD